MMKVTNASGHEVKVEGGILTYHVERMLEAIRVAIETGMEFAAVLAVDHAIEAARAARG